MIRWFDVLKDTDLDAVFVNGFTEFYCPIRRTITDKSITHKLYKWGTFHFEGESDDCRGEAIIEDTTPYLEVTFTNKSVKIVLRDKFTILSTIKVKSKYPVGVRPYVAVHNEIGKILSYMKAIYW